jgi:HSP20 family protein
MKYNSTYGKEFSTYPGKYVPAEDLNADSNKLADPSIQPLVNLNEFNDHYKLEFFIPGVYRKDIRLRAKESTLTVHVLSNCRKENNENPRIHEFDDNPFNREIILPSNADLSFISAEYKKGILSIYIPKTEHPSLCNDIQIVVY